MKLLRCGAQHFHGWTTLSDKDPSVKWDAGEQILKVNNSSSPDPNDPFKFYDYSVELSPKDIEQILKCLGAHALLNPSDPLISSLSASTLHLLRLLMSASGFACSTDALKLATEDEDAEKE